MEAPTTAANRATLLDIAQGGNGHIEIKRCNFNFDKGGHQEPTADYTGPILVPTAEIVKFDAAVKAWQEAQGELPGGPYYALKFGHSTHQEAVEDAKKDYAASPCLVRHADGLYYMHGEDKPGRPTIVDVLIDEILQ